MALADAAPGTGVTCEWSGSAALDAANLRDRSQAQSWTEGMRDFGKKVDLCQRIRDVLTNYPEAAEIGANAGGR